MTLPQHRREKEQHCKRVAVFYKSRTSRWGRQTLRNPAGIKKIVTKQKNTVLIKLLQDTSTYRVPSVAPDGKYRAPTTCSDGGPASGAVFNGGTRIGKEFHATVFTVFFILSQF